MNVDGTKMSIKTVLSQPVTSPVKEIPVMQRRERIVDIANMDLSDDIENLRLQIARLKNENLDLQQQLKEKKSNETERYNRLFLYWKMLYEVLPDVSHRVAREFGVDLKRREFGYATEDFDAVFQAVCKTMFANEISVHEVNAAIEKATTQMSDEKMRREYAEKELHRERNEKENFKTLFEAEKMKNDMKNASVMARIGSFEGTIDVQGKPATLVIKKQAEDENAWQEELKAELEEEIHAEDIFAEVDDLLQSQAEDDLVVSLLKEKGCEIHPSSNPKHSYLVEVGDKKVPLSYFDYTLLDSKVFDDIMKDTNEIYLVFDNKENWNKGNTQWTRWLLFSQRKKNIKFAMTTIDDIRQKGLTKIG